MGLLKYKRIIGLKNIDDFVGLLTFFLGESVPVTKSALLSSSEIYSTNAQKRHTLYSGTYILQTRYMSIVLLELFFLF